MYVIDQFDNQGEIQLRTRVIVFLKTFKKQYSHKKLVGVNFLHHLRPLSLLSPFSNSNISARKAHSQAGLATTSGKLKTKRVQGVIMLFKIHYSEFGWHTMRRPMSLTIQLKNLRPNIGLWWPCIEPRSGSTEKARSPGTQSASCPTLLSQEYTCM